MEKKGLFTKTLAIAGTGLVFLPILVPILFSIISLMGDHLFRLDYLMPAELFLVALAGGGLLLWVALRTHSERRLVGWSLGIAVTMLVGGQGLAVVTGLASGEAEPAGIWMALVLGAIVLYDLALIALGIGGIRLLRVLFKPHIVLA
jgi:hypothetical protein